MTRTRPSSRGSWQICPAIGRLTAHPPSSRGELATPTAAVTPIPSRGAFPMPTACERRQQRSPDLGPSRRRPLRHAPRARNARAHLTERHPSSPTRSSSSVAWTRSRDTKSLRALTRCAGTRHEPGREPPRRAAGWDGARWSRRSFSARSRSFAMRSRVCVPPPAICVHKTSCSVHAWAGLRRHVC